MKKLIVMIAAMLMLSCGNNLKEIELSSLESKDGVFYEKGVEEPFTGKVTAKYPDGKKMMESYWKNGKQDGKQKQYYEDGKIKIEGTFKNGKADGVIKVYDTTGKVILQEEWKDGERVGK
ncbi:toxin-antitoxin system YwqK family antitoxin [Fusobacterium varium]